MADLRAHLQETLGDGYSIERELGGGGMSRVFVAREREFGRLVVVKVLPPEVAAAVSTERFRREIHVAASLRHPHIVPLLNAGETDGIVFYTMPLIEGESLRARIAREAELPIGDCVRIAQQVADALAYAHARGVIHRDIKPDNVLLDGRNAVVTDFGVAKALGAASTEMRITSTGVVVGTPAYMAPEQAAGDSHIDARTDIYGFGVLLYEMLAGVPPFSAPTTQAMLAAHVARAPEPVDRLRTSVPAPLAALVMRCLEKRPADRPQSAEAIVRELDAMGPSTTSAAVSPDGQRPRPLLARALALFVLCSAVVLLAARAARDALGLPDWFLPAAAVLLLAGLPIIAATAVVQRPPGSGARVALRLPRWLTWRKAIAGGVLAFAGLGALTATYEVTRALGIGPAGSLLGAGALDERDDVLLADFENHTRDTLLGPVVTEAFRVDFEQSRAVSVVPVGDVRQALARMRRPPDSRLDEALAREIAVRDGIKVVVAGEIGAAGASYALSARLLSAADGRVLAVARETAADSTEILDALDALSRRLRERIGESLRSIRADPPLAQVTTGSLAALRQYAQAVRAVERGGDYPAALRLLEEAVALDSTFAMAHRALAIYLANQATDRARMVRATKLAYAYRDRLTDRERWLAIAAYQQFVAHDRSEALAAYRSLLESNPNDLIALNNIGVLYSDSKRFDSAQVYYSLARRVDTSDAVVYTNEASALRALGQVERAAKLLDSARVRFPGNPLVRLELVVQSAAGGDYDDSERRLRELAESFRDNPGVMQTVTHARASLAAIRGQLGESRGLSETVAARMMARGALGDFLAVQANIALRDALVAGAQGLAVARLDRALARAPLAGIEPLNRPYAPLAVAYTVAGQPARARALLAERQRVLPDEPGDRGYAVRRYLPLAALAIAERRGDDAITASRAADDAPCGSCFLPIRARAHEIAGNADSAIALYERFLDGGWGKTLFVPPTVTDFSDATQLAPSLRRLGELYEERGDTARAAHFYARFVQLWERADPELQPQVADVRRRLERLSAEPRR